MEEMSLSHLPTREAALRLAKLWAADILRENSDPSRRTREFERLWIRADYSKELQEVGTLDDEVYLAREMGQSEELIREWLQQRLKDFVREPVSTSSALS
jgi:hypothetical protein